MAAIGTIRSDCCPKAYPSHTMTTMTAVGAYALFSDTPFDQKQNLGTGT